MQVSLIAEAKVRLGMMAQAVLRHLPGFERDQGKNRLASANEASKILGVDCYLERSIADHLNLRRNGRLLVETPFTVGQLEAMNGFVVLVPRVASLIEIVIHAGGSVKLPDSLYESLEAGYVERSAPPVWQMVLKPNLSCAEESVALRRAGRCGLRSEMASITIFIMMLRFNKLLWARTVACAKEVRIGRGTQRFVVTVSGHVIHVQSVKSRSNTTFDRAVVLKPN
jgi:hypothetical protein